MWSLNQKISGLVFIKPNFPALKYGRDMENRGSKYFHTEFIEEKYKDIKLSESGLFVDETLPYVGASPDLVFPCSCSEKGCVEIKCPY